MSTYLSKASAVRKAKQVYGANWAEFASVGENQEGKWQVVQLPKKEIEVQPEPEAAAKKGESIRRVSAMSGACTLVWEIAGSMLAANPQARRKDIIQACVDRGVAYYTARTQYQKYMEALASSKI